ncbi:ATP-binding protein [Tepidiforma sp.]|uniref:two-component system sensor histidine kinase NtrB n=1 Tax=Tepidiforma sp. TaxID=2682230 RepID=UPI002ADE385A|nr:ATP-binding protein [Tepidiforma sp.]
MDGDAMPHYIHVGDAAQSWLEATVAGAPDGVLLIDRVGCIVRMNAAAERIFGLPSRDAVGRSVQEFVPLRFRERHAEQMESFVTTAVGPRGMQERQPIPALRANGEEFMAEVALIPVTLEGMPCTVCIVRDVTARLEMEAALIRAEKLESLRVLSAGLAHDFNNILAAVVGNAEFALLLVEEDSPVHLALHDIREAGRRAAEIVQQMIRFAGKGAPAPERLELSGIVGETLQLLRGSVGARVRTVTDFATEPVFVVADAVSIRQVVMNLVVNAAEAMAGQGGQLTVRTGRRLLDKRAIRACQRATCRGCGAAAPGMYALLEVVDTGVGMDAATRERIFDPFFSTKFTGRGLGLAAVAGIVSAHGGMIHVASRPGRGTWFRVFLPLAD